MKSRLLLLCLLAITAILTACEETQQEKMVRGSCEAIVRDFRLGKDEMRRCLKEEAYRAEMVGKRRYALAEQYTAQHNENFGVMALKGDPVGYKRISQITELTIKGIADFGAEAEAAIGQQFVIAGALWSSGGDGPDDKTLPSYTIIPDAVMKSAIINLSANSLNQHQLAFLEKYCWLNLGGDRSSLCSGDVFLTIRRDPRLPMMIDAEIDGMAMRPGNESAVLAVLSK